MDDIEKNKLTRWGYKQLISMLQDKQNKLQKEMDSVIEKKIHFETLLCALPGTKKADDTQ